jgi:hypothetical protein
MVTRKKDRPVYAMSLQGGTNKVIERLPVLVEGNIVGSVDFQHSALNFFRLRKCWLPPRAWGSKHEESETAGHLAQK